MGTDEFKTETPEDQARRRCNPLSDEPTPAQIAIVKRFGKSGLMLSAVGCWIKRNLLLS